MKSTNYDGKYLKIRKAIHEAGFDEFSQCGSVNRFHKMNIVCDSHALNKRFWVCVDGGYGVKDEFHISCRDLGKNGADERYDYKNQEEMVAAIRSIGIEIKKAQAIFHEDVAQALPQTSPPTALLCL